jgi:ribonucleoside-triphosphate reductase
MIVIKKDGTEQEFNIEKVISAVSKSAERCLHTYTDDEIEKISNIVIAMAANYASEHNGKIPISAMHTFAENALEEIDPMIAKSYRDYRNYKVEFCNILDNVYKKSQAIRYIGDVSNANTDSAMVSTQRSLIYGQLNKELYQKFFLNKEELQAARDGYIYIHDMKDRLDGLNCCLFDMKNVLDGGFEMGNQWYNEPKTLDVAGDVISDTTISAASQQYGGFTIPQVDFILDKYAQKSYDLYYNEYIEDAENNGLDIDDVILAKADKKAEKKVYRDMEQLFQSWEYRFNTVGSSRGDYPFIAVSFGLNTSRWGCLLNTAILRVRAGGQGKAGYKKTVLFPKLTFLYDEELHGPGKPYEYIFNEAIECSKKSMYPDYLSMSGEGYIPSMYKKYGKPLSLMGCRASLSPWYERGGMNPADENDTVIFEGRFNLGAVSLHLPMILAKARQENRDFYEVLDYYLEMIRNLHKKTIAFFGEKKASTNPMMFMQGGCLGGTLGADDKIAKLLPPMTVSFGIIALNELNRLYNGKSIYEDGEFPLEVMHYINDKVNVYKKEDGILYAIYGTPAESLCGLQVEQFRKKYGIIENVSDKAYVSNSFHCHVTEDITPIEKQDSENRFWNLFNGGKIQYCKCPINYNTKAMKDLVRRAMKLGLYEGINLDLAYCEDCGHEELNMHKCPKCGSENITEVQRMNGYLGFNKVKGKSRYNDAKRAEIADRVSM